MDEYDKAKFEAAFQLTTAVANQVIRVDYQEMKRWINNIMTPRTIPLGEDSQPNPQYDDQARPNLDNLLAVMDQFQTLKDALMKHGIPVRNIQHFRKTQGLKEQTHGADQHSHKNQ